MVERASIFSLTDGDNSEGNERLESDGNSVRGTAGDGSTTRPSLIDPTSFGSENGSNGDAGSGGSGSSDSPRKRGRKKGSRNSQKTETIAVEGLAAVLYNIHGMLAVLTSTPEMGIEQTEADNLAKGVAMVNRHYNMAVAAKTVDWCNLGIIAATIYAPRIAALRINAANKRAERRRTAPRPDTSAPEPQYTHMEEGGAAYVS